MNKGQTISISDESGFSLIEVVISTVLMGFMTLAIYKVTNNSIETKTIVTSEDREYVQMVSALHRIDTDFSQIYSPLFHTARYISKEKSRDANEEQSNTKIVKFTPSEQFPMVSVSGEPIPKVESEDKSTLSFFSRANRRRLQDVKQSRISWIRYSLRNLEKKEGEEKWGDYELVRQSSSLDPYSPEMEWGKVKEQVLLKGIKELSFEFWSTKGKKFVDRITDLPTEDRNSLRGLRVNLEMVAMDGAKSEISRTFRPLYPYFNTVKDELSKLDPEKGKKQDSDD